MPISGSNSGGGGGSSAGAGLSTTLSQQAIDQGYTISATGELDAPVNVANDITKQLLTFEASNAPAPVDLVDDTWQGVPLVRLSDNNTNGFANYNYSLQIPEAGVAQYLRIVWRLNPLTLNNAIIRLAKSGTVIDTLLNIATGEVTEKNAGQTFIAKNETRSDGLQETVIKYETTVADLTGHFIFPAGGANTTTNFTDTRTGDLDIAELDFDYPFEVVTPQVITTDNSGLYRTGVVDQTVALGTTDTAVSTGFDLTQPDLYLEFEFSDSSGDTRAWQTGKLRVDRIIERFNDGDTVDGYVSVFDNDFVIINLVDAATGQFEMRYNGRAVGSTRIELYQVAQEIPSIIKLEDFTSFSLTTAFQPLSAPNVLFNNDDGAKLYIRYGDGNLDEFTFLDGEVSAERNGFDTIGISARITGSGQIEIASENGSTADEAWYQFPLKAIALEREPYLLVRSGDKYEDSATSNVFKVDVYSDGTNTRYNARLADDTGDYFRLITIPSTYTQIFPLEPTLTLDADAGGAISSFFNRDSFDLMINFQNNFSNAINLEIFLENRPYATIPNLVLPTLANGTTPTFEGRINSDGTYNYLFTMQLSAGENQLSITSDALTPAGDNDNGSNPPSFLYENA